MPSQDFLPADPGPDIVCTVPISKYVTDFRARRFCSLRSRPSPAANRLDMAHDFFGKPNDAVSTLQDVVSISSLFFASLFTRASDGVGRYSATLSYRALLAGLRMKLVCLLLGWTGYSERWSTVARHMGRNNVFLFYSSFFFLQQIGAGRARKRSK